MSTAEDSPIRFCRKHQTYYVAELQDKLHEKCGEHSGTSLAAPSDSQDTGTYPLQWREVIYYLNKLRRIRELFSDIRTELSI